MTIAQLIIAGAAVGFAIALVMRRGRQGCALLLLVPLSMIAFVILDQSVLHPENVRSTSALELIFGPLWPTLGAVGGFAMGLVVRVARES